jgi:hypothetical protein
MYALVTRVREADAYAFTGAMIAQMNYATAVLNDALRSAKEIMQKTGKKTLSENDMSNVTFMAALNHGDPPPDPRRQMADTFRRFLCTFDDYDRKALSRYHALYTHPDWTPRPHAAAGDALDIPKLRQILKCGVTPDAPVYMDSLDDKAFSDLVLKDIAPKIRDAMRLMDSFESAAKGSLSANDNLDMRERIHDKVVEAEKEPKPDIEKIRAAIKKAATPG